MPPSPSPSDVSTIADMHSMSLSTGAPMDHVSATISAAQSADSSLGDANTISCNHPDHPLRRTLVCNIRASLSDLCLRKQKGVWAPSGEALRAMLQQKKFTSLDGTSEASGDLKVRACVCPLPPIFKRLHALSRTFSGNLGVCQPSGLHIRPSKTVCRSTFSSYHTVTLLSYAQNSPLTF